MSNLRVRVSVAVLATITSVTPVARADPPAPGDACTVLHAIAQDAHNRTMWCNPAMTGAHTLVWQYGGPAPNP